MTTTVRRAAAFAAVGTLAILVPAIVGSLPAAIATVAAPAPFILIAALALFVVSDGTVFELFARPGDRRDGRLYGLAGFALAAAGLALLAVRFEMPLPVYVATVVVIAYGNLGGHVVRTLRNEPILATGGFVVVGAVAGTGGYVGTVLITGQTPEWPVIAFLAASGGLLAALLREVLFERDDPLVMVSTGLFLWLFADLQPSIQASRIAVALGVVLGLGYLSYALQAASIAGMLTGVLLSLLTIVLGDYGWFFLLISFFGSGALATKIGYETKRERGIAEENEGARGTGNVLANALVGLVALLLSAASPRYTGVTPLLFLFVFAGSLAAATSDTLSSEIGGLYDDPRLITTLERVDPGTDGAVTWQGELAGVGGAALITVIASASFEAVTLAGGGVVFAAGIVGMTVDSLLGATVEGQLFGNQGVNFCATLAAGVASVAVAVATGVIVL